MAIVQNDKKGAENQERFNEVIEKMIRNYLSIPSSGSGGAFKLICGVILGPSAYETDLCNYLSNVL